MTTKVTGILVLFLFSILSTSCAKNKEEKKVRAAFDGYKSAILNDKGEEAVKFLDSRTVQYYENMLDFAKNADKDQVNSLSFFDRMMVLFVRYRVSKEDILSFNGEKLLIYSIESGMVSKSSVVNGSIGKISIADDFAKGQLHDDQGALPLYYHFYKEDGQWKLDLTSSFTVAEAALKQVIKESGMEENEYIFAALEVLTGKKPGKEIWETIQ